MGRIYAFAPALAPITKDAVPVPPSALPENAGLAWRGEQAWPRAQLTDRQAKLLLAAGNRCGRPNADVLRKRLAVAAGAPVESWQFDFPAHFTDQEAALYEEPFARLAGGWRNPHANPDLRRALARLSRYLAMPADAEAPDWLWVEEDLLPDASLVVVAREDDFTHGVLASAVFAAWYAALRAVMPAEAIVASFPFPRPPATPLGALTKEQEEQRHAVARAARAGNPEQLDDAVARAYGWPTDLGDVELAEALVGLHDSRPHLPFPSS
jgi:hypothetical protein